MNVVTASVPPPVGPTWTPVISSRSHGIAFGLTMAEPVSLAQTVLVSRESCQVTRTGPFAKGVGLGSNGLGLKKWVVSCSCWSLNNVACGVNNVQATCPTDAAGWHS